MAQVRRLWWSSWHPRWISGQDGAVARSSSYKPMPPSSQRFTRALGFQPQKRTEAPACRRATLFDIPAHVGGEQHVVRTVPNSCCTSKRPTQILPAICASFHAIVLQDVRDHAPEHSSSVSRSPPLQRSGQEVRRRRVFSHSNRFQRCGIRAPWPFPAFGVSALWTKHTLTALSRCHQFTNEQLGLSARDTYAGHPPATKQQPLPKRRVADPPRVARGGKERAQTTLRTMSRPDRASSTCFVPSRREKHASLSYHPLGRRPRLSGVSIWGWLHHSYTQLDRCGSVIDPSPSLSLSLSLSLCLSGEGAGTELEARFATI